MAQLAFPDLTLALPEIFLGAAASALIAIGMKRAGWPTNDGDPPNRPPAAEPEI